MLQHFASWHLLLLVALLDVSLILLHLMAPTASPGLPALLPSRPNQADHHAKLLEHVHQERWRLKREMKQKVEEMKSITRTLRLRADTLDSFDRSLLRLEDSLRRLAVHRDNGGGGFDGGGDDDAVVAD